MLNLSNYKILDMQESKNDYRFLVESGTPPPTHCPIGLQMYQKS